MKDGCLMAVALRQGRASDKIYLTALHYHVFVTSFRVGPSAPSVARLRGN